MDLSTLKDWAAVLATVLGFGTFAVNVLARRSDRAAAARATSDTRFEGVCEQVRTNTKRLDRMDDQHLDRRVEAMGEIVNIAVTRIGRLEARMESVATRDDVAKVDRSVVALGGQLDVLCERLRPIAHTTERLQEYLLDPAPPPRGTQP